MITWVHGNNLCKTGQGLTLSTASNRQFYLIFKVVTQNSGDINCKPPLRIQKYFESQLPSSYLFISNLLCCIDLSLVYK